VSAPGGPEIGLIPASLYLEPGSAVPLIPTTALESGGALSWTSTVSAVATVSGQGLVTALSLGSTEVRASNPRGTARSRVTVVPPANPVLSWQVSHRGLTDASLLGVWSVDAQTSFTVGSGGNILRTDDGGATWTPLAAPDSTDLVGVWGQAPSDVWAVGVAGTILHYDGTRWARVASPTTRTLLEVWGLAPDDVYAVGAGVALHYDGLSWQAMSGTENAELWAVWGTDRAHLFAAGQNGVLFRLEGSHWTGLASPTQLLLLGLWGVAGNDIYAVGIRGTILHWDGIRWSAVPSPTRTDLFAVWGRSGGEILAVGDHGTMALFNGSVWTVLPQSATGENLRGVHSAALGGFVVVGWSGTAIARRTNGSWQLGATSPLLFDLADGPGARYAIGGTGAVLRGTAAGWTTLEVPPRTTATWWSWGTAGPSCATTARAGARSRLRPAGCSARSGWMTWGTDSSSANRDSFCAARGAAGSRCPGRRPGFCAMSSDSTRAMSMRWVTPERRSTGTGRPGA
jgi:hypothetical protein